ncbi:MAG TPA: MATE family efflux transporter [Firmicutes bacterium]|nr:MATE family efflux transporter [Bacillota bacterium]
MEKEYLIREKPLKAMTVFAVPMIIGNLFQQFYTMADSAVVGRFVGEGALAAVGASYALTTVFISIAIGGGVGASVITGSYFGAREYRKMKASIRTALISFFILSVFLGSVGLLFSRQILEALNTPESVMEQAVEYLNIYFLGLPFLFMYNILSSMFNALGRSRIPLGLLIFSSVFNVILDLYMVCSLHMGVAGAAWATLIAQGISAAFSFVIFLRGLKQYETGEERVPLFDRKEFSNMARVALPSILQQSTVSIGLMLVQSVVNGFGEEMLAGYSAAMRIENIATVPMSAMGNVMSAYVAQNIGAKQYDRVRTGYRTGIGMVAGFAAVICVILELFYRPLIFLFLGEEGTAAAMKTGMDCLRYMGWFYVLIGMKMTTDGVLRGAGDMTVFTVANLVNLSIRVIVAAVFAPVWGIVMVWAVVPAGWLVNFLISYTRYRTGKWREKAQKLGG